MFFVKAYYSIYEGGYWQGRRKIKTRIKRYRLRHNEGLIAEISGDLSTAKNHMKYAYENSYRKNERQGKNSYHGYGFNNNRGS